MSYPPLPGPGARPKSREAWWTRLLVALIVPTLAVGTIRGCREIRGFVWSTFGFRQVYESPRGTSKVLIVITDEGFGGWGCLHVYEHSLLNGYSFVSRYCEAIAIDGASVTWLDETSLEVTFVDPDIDATTITVDLR